MKMTSHTGGASAGFVARKPHPTDRRAALVTPSEQGEAVAAAWQADHHLGAGRLFAGVSDADLATFAATLDLVLDRLHHDANQEAARV
jgi:DNA-binding MarR family transcriptional regulator